MKIQRLISYSWQILILTITISCATGNKEEAMKATSNSDQAKKYYNNAYKIAYGVLKLDKAVSLYQQAIEEDPNFFMAYYQLATFYLFHQNDKEFIKNAKAAIACDNKLSEGEKIQKNILKDFLNNNYGDAVKLGVKLVEIYPNDPDSYFNLGFIYYLNKDYSNAINIFEKSLTMENIGSLYCGPKLAIVPICMLGYSSLISGRLDKAKESFDEYISQFPEEQNPYDCKADYFIAMKEYESAFDSYMTAYKIDTTYKVFLKRALYIKELADSMKNKK